LGKKESDMHFALEELERQAVCTRRADGVIEIRDRFWPYQREYDSAASDESRRYVEEVKRRFLQRRCVQSSFTAADEKLALTLHHRGVSLLHVEHAIWNYVAHKVNTFEKTELWAIPGGTLEK
jgi:uncharacterized sporulation protein YeaH/YhbH (DUF444 family)